MMNKQFKKFTLNNFATHRFTLTPLELKDYIDFDIKRIYWIIDPKDQTGEHCHYKEEELFVMLQGSCTAIIDRGNGKEEVSLDGPQNAIYVPNYVWHGFKDFSEGAVLLALTSTNYNPDRSDYLEDYEKYLEIRDEHLSKE